MAVHHTTHARVVANDFRDLIFREDGATLSDHHLDQLTLLVESAIDTAVLEQMERVAGEIGDLARKLSYDAEHYRRN